jgi:hypothetical protein
MRVAAKGLFFILFVGSLIVNFIFDLAASFYLVSIGEVGWVALAWILGGLPSFLLPLFTPYAGNYLLSWGVTVISGFILFGVLSDKADF